tara:strand:+ start:343 stop:495 length:153 start_codon:yes stop_codon:yes gene_type:complete
MRAEIASEATGTALKLQHAAGVAYYGIDLAMVSDDARVLGQPVQLRPGET